MDHPGYHRWGGDPGSEVPVSDLLQKQFLFSRCLGSFLLEVHRRGWACTLAEVGVAYDRKSLMGLPFKDGVHMKHSLHYCRLAADVNLFVQEEDGAWRWVTHGDDPAWISLGEYWESLDPACTWGGHFGDANHISVTNHGRM